MNRSIRRTAQLGAAILLTGLLVQPARSAQSTPTWIRPPATVSDPAVDSMWQEVDTNARGDTMVVWHTNGDFTAQAAWHPAGGPWADPVTVSSADRTIQEADVALDDKGRATVIWRDVTSGPSTIVTRTRSPGGTWGAAVPLSGAGSAFKASIAEDGGATAVAWYENVPLTSDYLIRVAIRPVGSGWQEPDTLGLPAEQFDPAVGMGGGRVAVVWRDRSSGSNVVMASVTSNGAVWTTPKPLSAAGKDAQEPSVVIDDARRVTVVWRLTDGSDTVIQSRTRGATGTWGPVKTVSDADVDASSPVVAVDPAAGLTAAWLESEGGHNVVVASVGKPGKAWSDPDPLSDPGLGSWDPDVAAGPKGSSVVTWSSIADIETRDTVWASRRVGGGSFKAAKLVAPLATENATDPAVAMDSHGDAVVASRRWSGTTYVIAATPLDAVAPRIVGFAVPARGRVGTRLRFRSTIVDTWSAVSSKVWSFGDGGTAIGGNVRHKYKRPGTYVVKLITTDAVGNTRTRKTTISVTR